MHLNLVPILFLLIFVTLCTYFGWRYWKFNRAYAKLPSSRFGFSGVFRIISKGYLWNESLTCTLLQIMVDMAKPFQKEGFFVLWFFRPYIIVFSEELVKRFSNDPVIANKSTLYEMIEDVIGNGLLTSKEERWKKHRKLLMPAFYVGALKAKLRIFNDCATDMVTKLEKISGQTTYDMINLIKHCSFSIMADSILGLKLNDEKYDGQIENYLRSMEEVMENFVYKVPQPWLQWKFLVPLFPAGRNVLKLRDKIHTFTQEILSEMKKSVLDSNLSKEVLEEDPDSEMENKKSFARILLEQHVKDPTFTIEDVEAEVKVIMAAAHDTTSHLILFCLYELGLHPDIQEKVFKEAEFISGRDVSYDDVLQLKYLECVIKEGLRMYAPIPIYARKLNKEVKWGDYTIPNGAEMAFFLFLMHRSENLFPDPDKFDPDRFLDSSTDIRPYNYTPFAEGYRTCPGKRYAMLQVKIVLAHVIRRFKIQTLEKLKCPDELEWAITLKPAKPIPMLFTLR